jgi:hypothetical protein
MVATIFEFLVAPLLWLLEQWRPFRRAETTLTASGRHIAFISFRHSSDDRGWAKWLHRSLESYRIPARLAASRKLPCRLGRCFRDEEELAATPKLGAEIEQELVRSDWLIVVCSPRAKQSRWIDAEITYFKQLGRADRVLALLIDGEPSSAFPTPLFELRKGVAIHRVGNLEEPLAADIRAPADLWPWQRHRLALLRLVATMVGCRFDELRQREQEQQSRRLVLLLETGLHDLHPLRI